MYVTLTYKKSMFSNQAEITIPLHGLLPREQFCPAGGWGLGSVPGWVQDFGQGWVQDSAPESQLWAEGPPCLLATEYLVQSRLYNSTWSPGVWLAIDGQLPRCLREPSCDNRLLCIKHRVVTGKIISNWHVGVAIVAVDICQWIGMSCVFMRTCTVNPVFATQKTEVTFPNVNVNVHFTSHASKFVATLVVTEKWQHAFTLYVVWRQFAPHSTDVTTVFWQLSMGTDVG